MLRNFFTRLREPSSLAGLAGLTILFGVEPLKANMLMEALAGVLAAGAILLPETTK